MDLSIISIFQLLSAFSKLNIGKNNKEFRGKIKTPMSLRLW